MEVYTAIITTPDLHHIRNFSSVDLAESWLEQWAAELGCTPHELADHRHPTVCYDCQKTVVNGAAMEI